MAIKVGEGYVEIETRIDLDAFVKASRAMAQRASLAFGKDYNDGIRRAMRSADEQFDVHMNKQISSVQALERQRVKAHEDSAKRILQIQNDIASSVDKDRRLSDAYAKEGARAAKAFENEQNASFSRITNSYRKGLVSLGGNAKRVFSSVNDDIDVDIDHHSKRWASTLEHNLSRGVDAALSLLPGRMESLFSGRGGPIGLALGGVLLSGIAAVMPAIGAMVAGSIFGGLGLAGVLAAVLVGVADDQRVKNAAGRIAQTFKDAIIYSPATAAIGGVLAAQIDKANVALKKLAPVIQDILVKSSKFFAPLTDGILYFFDVTIRAFDRLMASPFMTALMTIISKGLKIIGDAFAISIDRFLKDPDAMAGAAMGLEDAFNLAAGAIKLFFDILRSLSRIWKDWNTDPDGPGPLVSKIDRMRQLWKDIFEQIKDIKGEFKIAFGEGSNFQKASNAAKHMRDDLHEIAILWDGINGRQQGQPSMGGQRDFNAEGAGLGSADPSKFWQNQWEDFQGELKIAMATSKKKIGDQFREMWHSIWVTWSEEFTIWKGLAVSSIEGFKIIWANLWRGTKSEFVTMWHDFTQTWSEEFGIWKNAWGSFTGGIISLWQGFWSSIATTFKGKWAESVQAFFQEVEIWKSGWNAFTGFLGMIWSTSWDSIRNTFTTKWTETKLAYFQEIEIWKAAWNAFTEWLKLIWNVAWTAIKDFFVMIWGVIWTFLQFIFATIRDFFQAMLLLIKSIWESVWTAIKNFFLATWTWIRDTIVMWFTIVKQVMSDTLDAIQKKWNEIWEGIKNVLGGIWQGIAEAVRGGINSVIDILNSGIRAINSVLDKLNISFRINEIGRLATGGIVSGDDRGSIRGNATGGHISGPGTGTSDSIVRRLSNGEYVIRTKSAKDLGYQNLDYMNRTGKLPGLAGGGRVGSDNNALLEQHRNHVHVAMNVPRMGFEAIIQKAAESGLPFSVGSTYRSGSRGSGGGLDHHSEGRAVDFPGFNQDAFASFWEHAAGVIELIHRTSSRDYAIFGGKGSFINEFLARGIDWIMDHMLNPAVNAAENLLPPGLPGEIGRGTLHGLRDALKAKIQEAISNAAAADASSGGGGGAGVQQWSGTAAAALARLGMPASWLGGLLSKMQQESGGNPRAINNTDINAQRGDPSRGLMQVIGSTFAAYRDPGLSGDIYDPLSNITAALRYISARYGGVPNLPAGGYDNGGYLPPGIWNGTRTPEPVFTGSQWGILKGNIGQGWNGTVNVYIDGVKTAHEAVVEENNMAVAQHLYRGQ